MQDEGEVMEEGQFVVVIDTGRRSRMAGHQGPRVRAPHVFQGSCVSVLIYTCLIVCCYILCAMSKYCV